MMGSVSFMVLGIADKLAERIVLDYDCVPQIIVGSDCVGFNVKGFEAGRVGRGDDGNIYGIYYTPGSQPMRAVFS